LVILLSRCAQITPLTGGKKDVDPPRLLEATPANASLNFNAKKVELVFNEYVVLKDLPNQLIVTPQLKQLPNVEVSGKKVIIRFNDSLQPNTTYKLAFGNAITDMRENNPFQNFEYIFSTGSRIDSLTLQGHVTNAIDNRASAGLLVSLYDASVKDSSIYSQKPLYIARTGDDGRFSFNYLPGRSFRLLAIQDKNKNLMYDGPDEMIAFADSMVRPDPADHGMKLFRELPSKTFIRKAFSTEYGKMLLVFNRPYSDYTILKAEGMQRLLRNATGDTVSIFYKDRFDTARVYVSFPGRKTDTVTVKLATKENVDKLIQKNNLKYNLSSNLSGGMLNYLSVPSVSLNYPAGTSQTDLGKVRLYELKDSIRIPVTFTAETDSSQLSYRFNTTLAPGKSYEMLMGKGVFRDTDGRSSDSVSYKFKTTVPEDYSRLTIKLLFPKKENYLVLLLDEKETIVRTEKIELSLTSTAEQKFDFKNLLPGNYFIKVVEDANKNGRFDEGHFIGGVQPEVIYYNTTAIKLLADWEIENEWKVE